MRYRRTALGAVLTAIAIGLREVFEPRRRDRSAYEAPAPATPEPDPFTNVVVHVDPDEPRRSYAVIRDRHRYVDDGW